MWFHNVDMYCLDRVGDHNLGVDSSTKGATGASQLRIDAEPDLEARIAPNRQRVFPELSGLETW